jgi:hypothetical protein
MDMELIKRWVERMERNEDRKGKARLHTLDFEGNHCYCALGLLADEYIKGGGSACWEKDGSDFLLVPTTPGFTSHKGRGALPCVIEHEIGIGEGGQNLIADSVPVWLLNDCHEDELSFPDIAARVKEHLAL